MRFAIVACLAAAAAQTADFTSWMDSIAQRQLAARRDAIAKVQDRPAAEQRQAQTRAKYLQLIGGLPDYNGPLNARTVGTIPADRFTIERVLYESFPGYFVTANVYRPAKSSGRHPAVLLSLGHWNEGKAAAQLIAANLALNGFVVLAYDPVGQGERAQGYDPRVGVTRGTTDQHILAGGQALLTGKSMASYMIHDAKRSIDYLVSRPDVDPERIGATGCSGGGTLTTFISAIDPRVKVAAPACYITSFELLFKGSVGDSEQSTPGFLASGLDQVDFIEMFAPKPWLIANTKEDFFPLEGARRAYEEAKGWYKLFGAEDRIAWVVGPGGHGTPIEVREAIYAWMKRWLQNDATPVRERPVATYPEHALWVSKSGQIAEQSGARDLWQVIRENYKPVDNRDPIGSVRAAVSQPKATSRVISEASDDRFTRQTIGITVEPDLEITGILIQPKSGQLKKAVVVVEQSPTKLSATAERFAQAGATVLALRPRGIEDSDSRRDLISDWLVNTRAFLIGRNLATMRAQDVLAATTVLTERTGSKDVLGAAQGSAGVWLMMAAAVEPRLTKIWLDGTPYSFRAALNGPVHRNLHDALMPGVKWDLPELRSALGTDRVLWTDPTNWVHKVPLEGAYTYTSSDANVAADKQIREFLR